MSLKRWCIGSQWLWGAHTWSRDEKGVPVVYETCYDTKTRKGNTIPRKNIYKCNYGNEQAVCPPSSESKGATRMKEKGKPQCPEGMRELTKPECAKIFPKVSYDVGNGPNSKTGGHADYWMNGCFSNQGDKDSPFWNEGNIDNKGNNYGIGGWRYCKKDDKAKYEKRPKNTNCPAGSDITTQAECQKAIRTLGLKYDPWWTGNHGNIPRGCTWTDAVLNNKSRGSLSHWNAWTSSAGKPRYDLHPICAKGKEEKMLEIKVGPGSKGNNSKTVSLPVSCPSFMLDSSKKTNQQYPHAVKNKQNPAWGDRFQLDVEDKKLTVKRLDTDGYWGQDLILLASPDGKGCEETKQRKKAIEEARLAALEAERKRKEAEEAARKAKEAEEAARKAKEESERKRLAEIARKAAEEAARKKAAAEKAAAEAKAKAAKIAKENADGAAAGWRCIPGISTPVRLDKNPVKGHKGDGTGEVSCMSSNAKDCKWGQCPSLKIPTPNKPVICGPKHKEAGWGGTGYDGGDKHWCNIAKKPLKYKAPPAEPDFYKAQQQLLGVKLDDNMKKVGDGCCRFGGIEKGEDKGYRTLGDCLKLCSGDSRCRGADVKGRKLEDKFHCFHYLNDKKPSDYNIGCKEWNQGEKGPYQCYQKIPNEYVTQKTLCKDEYKIKTFQECKEAALELKTGWRPGRRSKSLSNGYYYPGCSLYERKKTLLFNTSRSGKPHKSYSGICIKDPSVKAVKEVAKEVQKQAQKQGLPPQLVKQKVKQAVVKVKTAPNPVSEAKKIVPEAVAAPLAAAAIKTDTPPGDVPQGGPAPIPAGPVAVSGQDPAVIQNAVREAAAQGQDMRGQALAAQKIQTKRAALGGMAVQSAIPRSQMIKASGLRGGPKSPWQPLGQIGGDAAGGGDLAPIGPNRQLKQPPMGQQGKDVQEVVKFHEASFHAQNGKKITGGKLSGENLKGIAYKTRNMAWCIPHKNKKGQVISWIAKPNRQMGWDSRDQCLTMKGGKPVKIPYGSGKCIKGNTQQECKIALKNLAKDAYWHTHPVLMERVKQKGPSATPMKFV